MHAEEATSPPFGRSIQVGQEVPDFRLESYNPRTGSFDEIRLSELRQRKKWTILFFYPADFTFV